ncbi:MAG: DoxX family protein [Anaerolineales bacterium]|nr:DoxX family protein [Anaerolineales bacterium]
MNIALWIVQVLLGIVFAGAGYGKVFRQEQAAAQSPMMAWVGDVPKQLLTFIGLSEMAGALGLIVPALSGVLPWLTPLAAALLALVMILAFGFHLVRKEYQNLVANLFLFLLAAFVAWGRWGLFGG